MTDIFIRIHVIVCTYSIQNKNYLKIIIFNQIIKVKGKIKKVSLLVIVGLQQFVDRPFLLVC